MSLLHQPYRRFAAYVTTLTMLGFSSLLSSCGSPDERARDSTPDMGNVGAEIVTFEETASTCRDCIELEPIVVLGDSTGDGYLEAAEYMTRDSLGNYWVGQRNTVKVFSSNGTFLKQVGRSGGGPMEFSGLAAPAYVDDEGRVHIIDLGNPRETVVSPDFELAAETRLPGFVQAAVPLPDGRRMAVNMVLETPDQIGLPLHIIEGSQILRSFGRTENSGVVTPLDLQRVVTTDAAGRIYSAPPYDYVIEVWSDEGEKIRAFTGPRLNETEPLPGSFSPDNPPPNRIFSLHMDEAQRLWIARWVLRPDWRENMVEAAAPNGRIQFKPKDDSFESIYRSRIDVIDSEDGSMIATMERDELITGFMDDALVFENRLAENGNPQLAVWRVDLTDPNAR